MTFLASIYLWFLPLITIPIIFHLIRKRKFNTIYFSSLKFFINIEKESIKKVNIINILLLIIRTLIILFIILIFSNPVINGILRSSTHSESTILNICIDNSYSNTAFINNNLNKLVKNILNNYPDNARVIVQSIDGNAIADDLIKNINIDFSKATTYNTFTLNRSLNDLSNDYYNKYRNKDLFIISDFQEHVVKDFDYLNSSIDDWNTFSYKHNIKSDKLSLHNLKISENNIMKNELFDISIQCSNLSDISVSEAKIDLYINNTKVGENLINLDAGSNDIIIFKTSIADTGKHKCFFILNNKKYYFIINIPEIFTASLLYNNYSDAKHIYNLLSTYKDLGVNLDIDTSKSIISLNKKKDYDFMFKFGFSDLDNISINALKKSTKKLFLIPNDNFSLNSILDDESLTDISLLQTENRPATLDNFNINSIFLKNIFKDQKKPYKIYNHYKLPKTDNTLLSLSNNYSLLNKYTFDNLLIYLFSLPLDLNSSNIPISSLFIPLFDHLLFSEHKNNNFYVGDNIDFNKSILSDTLFYKINNKVDYYKSDFIFNNGICLNEPGFHSFKFNDNIKYDYSANINPIEYTDDILSEDEILKYIPSSILINEKSDINEIISSQISGFPIWRILLYILVILIIIEMYLSNIYIYKDD
tara:strand:+ start:553 stop:2490 length:1938 start_codon:yes stop_codon:yes gene_type:complete